MISFQAIGLQQAINKINAIRSRLGQPQNGLVKATNAVAGVFAKNYDSEGGLVGGWPDLADRTISMRQWQGFDAGPIMIRYGALREVSVAFFQTAKAGEAISAGDSYSDQNVDGSLKISGSVATLHVGGSYKVLNQFGYPDTNGSGDNPPRPYWFINDQVVASAEMAVKDWIVQEVLP